MTRRPFSRTTMLAAWKRAGGCCADCGRKLFPGDGVEYDHIIADEHGGSNEPDNCQVLCVGCHKPKTRADMEVTVRGRKARAQHIGANKPRRPMPGSKDSKWRKPLHGPAVLRDGE
ncbi:MAG: HNH endonuclease [Planctomycetes bacterium]|nr:HNH endonuclease [Planctomycetota bacterium]